MDQNERAGVGACAGLGAPDGGFCAGGNCSVRTTEDKSGFLRVELVVEVVVVSGSVPIFPVSRTGVVACLFFLRSGFVDGGEFSVKI